LNSPHPQKVLQAASPADKGEPDQESIDAVGRAMVLAYLAATRYQVSANVEAWAMDRDVRSTANCRVYGRVLLTKNQLSDLQRRSGAWARRIEKTQLDPANFLTSCAARRCDGTRSSPKLGKARQEPG